MTWARKFVAACSLMATAAVAPAQDAISEDSIAKPQRSTDPIGFYRANDVVGMTIRGANGEDLGKIQDIVIDSRSNEVQYFLLDPAPTVKVDGVLVMPWTYVVREYQARPQVQYITVDLPRERLLQAPVLRRTELRSFRTNAPVRIFQQVDQFYGITRNVLRPNLDGRGGVRGNLDADGSLRGGIRGEGRNRDERPNSDRRSGRESGERNGNRNGLRPDAEAGAGAKAGGEAGAGSKAGGEQKSDSARSGRQPGSRPDTEKAPRPGTQPESDQQPGQKTEPGTKPVSPSTGEGSDPQPSTSPGSSGSPQSPSAPTSPSTPTSPSPGSESPSGQGGTSPTEDPTEDPTDD